MKLHRQLLVTCHPHLYIALMLWAPSAQELYITSSSWCFLNQSIKTKKVRQQKRVRLESRAAPNKTVNLLLARWKICITLFPPTKCIYSSKSVSSARRSVVLRHCMENHRITLVQLTLQGHTTSAYTIPRGKPAKVMLCISSLNPRRNANLAVICIACHWFHRTFLQNANLLHFPTAYYQCEVLRAFMQGRFSS